MKRVYKFLRINGKRVVGDKRKRIMGLDKPKRVRANRRHTRKNYRLHPILIIWIIAVSGALIGCFIDNLEFEVKAEYNPCGLEVVECDGEVKGTIREISYYSEKDSCHNPVDGGCLTASGKIAKAGMVAANDYDFGTRLKIGGVIYTVEDRISERYSHRIDIWVGMGDEAHQLALSKGIEHLRVEVLD